MESDLIELEISAIKNIVGHARLSKEYDCLNTDLGKVIKHMDSSIVFMYDIYSLIIYENSMLLYNRHIDLTVLTVSLHDDNCIKKFFREHPEFTYALLRLSNILDEWKATN